MRVCLVLLLVCCVPESFSTAQSRFEKALNFVLEEAEREGRWLSKPEAEEYARELLDEENKIGFQLGLASDLDTDEQSTGAQDVPRDTKDEKEEIKDDTKSLEQATGLTESDMKAGGDKEEVQEQSDVAAQQEGDPMLPTDSMTEGVPASSEVGSIEEPSGKGDKTAKAEKDSVEHKRHFSTNDYVPEKGLENWENKNKFLELKKLLRGTIQLPQGEGYIIDEKTYKFLKSLLRSREEPKPKKQKRDVSAVLGNEPTGQLEELVQELGEEMKEVYEEKELARRENALLTEALSYSAMKAITGDDSYAASELSHVEKALDVERELVMREESLKMADELAASQAQDSLGQVLQQQVEEEIRRQEAIEQIDRLVQQLQEQGPPKQTVARRSGVGIKDEVGVCEELLLLPLGCPVVASEENEFFFHPQITQLCDRHLACYNCGEALNLGPTECDEGFAFEMLKVCGNDAQCARQAVRLLSLVKQGHVYTGLQSEGLCSSRCLANFIKFGSN